MKSEEIAGHLILLMAPTGSGKGVLEGYLFSKFPALVFSVSCTTRQPRPGEQNGVEYHFLSRDEFERKITNGEFLEWAEFSGNLYGTLRSELQNRLRDGQVVLNEIELQGVEALKKLIPAEHRTIIYIEAGGWEVSKARAMARSPMTEEELQLRYERFLEESKSKVHADYVVENLDGHLGEAKQELEKIVANIFENVKIR